MLDFVEAENAKGNCTIYTEKCTVSFLNAISVLMK
jgi:hypothetical protein